MFLALDLMTITHQELLKRFVPESWTDMVAYASHMTVAFNPDEKTLLEFAPHMNQWFNIQLLGLVCEPEGICLLVKPELPIVSKNKWPHITLAMKEGVPPKFSNELIQKAEKIEWNIGSWINIKGKLTLLP